MYDVPDIGLDASQLLNRGVCRLQRPSAQQLLFHHEPAGRRTPKIETRIALQPEEEVSRPLIPNVRGHYFGSLFPFALKASPYGVSGPPP